jgi:O-acetyl-ADP-ribose deacetylase (regulator of RNase III)
MMTEIRIVIGDITKQNVDAIVNAANRTLLGGGGVDGAIHRAAGPELLEECRALNGCNTGESKITKGYNLPAEYVIHTVGPVWKDGASGEQNLLAGCYKKSLQIAKEYGIKSIAFPAVSTGVYRFPAKKAAGIALTETNIFIENNHDVFDFILFVCFDKKTFDVYQSLLI